MENSVRKDVKLSLAQLLSKFILQTHYQYVHDALEFV